MSIIGSAALDQVDWESTFRAWAKPSSDTEQERSENAERMIREAIYSSAALSGRNVDVFAQGSYRNNTNVRRDSDVDICVLCHDVYFADYTMAVGASKESTGFSPSSYTYAEFRNDVGAALVEKFGSEHVVRGKKAFDLHETSHRVDADVVACFEHHRFTGRNTGGSWRRVKGTQFFSDDGQAIVNWPQQHYDNGVAKNGRTGNRFKYLTRALKRLRNDMHSNQVAAAGPIPSYLVECLVWNVPDEKFGHDNYVDDMRSILSHTYNSMLKLDIYGEWGEVNELKYLFRRNQPWNVDQARAFVDAAWNYVGYQ